MMTNEMVPYLQEDGEEFLALVLFEDGMDYDECDLYYVSQEDAYQFPHCHHLYHHDQRSLPESFQSTSPLQSI